MKDFEPIAFVLMATVSGGASIPWGQIWDRIRPHLPPNGPTIPLGPFYPPKPDPRIA